MSFLKTLIAKAYAAAHGALHVPEITVEELKEIMDKKEDLLLIDCREKSEYAIAKIAGSTLIPMAEIPEKIGELDKEQVIAVHCHSGGRSARVVQHLKKNGFKHVVNVEGGIDAWSERIDPTVPKY